MPSRTLLAAVAVTSTTVSPMLADDGALGLLGELAGLEGEGLVGARDGAGDGDGVSHGAAPLSWCRSCDRAGSQLAARPEPDARAVATGS